MPRFSDLYRLQFETVVYVNEDGVASSTSGHGRSSTRTGTKTQNSPQMAAPSDVPTQPSGLSPLEFLTNSTGFPFGIPVPDQAKDKGPDQSSKVDGDDASSLLSMELMIYDELMSDIGGTARFFDQDFRNSVLFGSTPPEDTGSVQGMGIQTPGQTYG